MKKLLLISLVIFTLAQVLSVAQPVLPSHVIEVVKVKNELDVIVMADVFEIMGINKVEVKEQEKIIYTYDDLNVTEDEFWWLTYLVFTEHNLGSDLSQECIVYTVMNRVAHSGYGRSIIEVITAPSQFSGYDLYSWGNYTERNRQNVFNALVKWNNGELPSEYYDILYFNNPDEVGKGYIKKYNLVPIVVEDGHTYYGKGE